MPRLNWLSLTPSSAALLEPARRRIVVGRAVGAHREQHRQIVHGAGVALLGGHLVPGLGLGDVAVDADALLVEIADAVLRRRKAELGRLLVPFGGGLHVGLDAAPFGVARADLEQRLGVAGFGCFAQRQRTGIRRARLRCRRQAPASLQASQARASSMRWPRAAVASLGGARSSVGGGVAAVVAGASPLGAAAIPASAVSATLSSGAVISGVASVSG